MKILSLFANVGFGEYFFKRNGFEVVVALIGKLSCDGGQCSKDK